MGSVKSGNMESPERMKDRVNYYTGLAREYYSQYPTSLKDFVNDKEAMLLGDDILTEGLSTGYNFVYEDYPLPSESGVILYSVYSQRYKHFGTVLAKMENLRIVNENSFKLFTRGTKIAGNYTDPELEKSHLQSVDGQVIDTLESVGSGKRY